MFNNNQLHLFKEIESSMNVTDGVKQETNVSKCFVTSNGKVNCSSVVYNDIKIWRQNRDSIDAKIKQLKSELETLKVSRFSNFYFFFEKENFSRFTTFVSSFSLYGFKLYFER